MLSLGKASFVKFKPSHDHASPTDFFYEDNVEIDVKLWISSYFEGSVIVKMYTHYENFEARLHFLPDFMSFLLYTLDTDEWYGLIWGVSESVESKNRFSTYLA